jgi:ribonucleoside-diphosphate reductase alpha chain
MATVDAYDLWKKILVSRVETGEPYLFFKDTANRFSPTEYQHHEREIKTSNLCSEIMLHTDEKTSGVCCLTSVNLEYFDEWETDSMFLEDIHRFTDNVLQSFIDLTEGKEGFSRARRGALEERSIGIGVMGYHSYLQAQNVPMDSLVAGYLTRKVFSHIDEKLKRSNIHLAMEKGKAPITLNQRNANVTSIAPTASISTLCNLTSPGVDARVSNVYTAKTNIGSYTIRNKYLEEMLDAYQRNTETVWKSITKNQGSVQHLDWMEDEDKEVFKTAYEINQLNVIKNLSIMQEHITQGISANLFLPADVHVKLLYDVHVSAWKSGLKSLYYVRSTSINRASVSGQDRIKLEEDTCIGCA